MAFKTIENNGNQYRKHINSNGKCKYYPELRCVCCNSECDHNCRIDDELEDELMDIFDVIPY